MRLGSSSGLRERAARLLRSVAPVPGTPTPARIALIYGAVAAVWIWSSDAVVAWLLPDPDLIRLAQTGKGLAFIAVTSGLVYLLALRLRNRIAEETAKRLEAERAWRHVRKMEAVGQLAGGLAHDFNNILGIVLGNLQLLRRSLGDDPERRDRVERALAGVERGTVLTRKLMRIARPVKQEEETVFPDLLLEESRDLIRNALRPAMTLDIRVKEKSWPIHVEPGAFLDALINLTLNARDAMPTDGRLVIELENRTLEPGHGGFDVQGDFVMISVSDSGSGIAAEIQDRIFDPFFTTKTRGTGLGLNMVYGFVQQSGGIVRLSSEPGVGTTFRLYLPRHHDAGSSVRDDRGTTAPSPQPPPSPQHGETVLVIDDETAIRKTAITDLGALGYRTIEAGGSEEALRIIADRPEIDLVLCDLVMPGDLWGTTLAQAIWQRRPGLPVLLCSGFPRVAESEAAVDNPQVAQLAQTILTKPYSRTELARAIRQALGKDG